jgi:hypothetical protein
MTQRFFLQALLALLLATSAGLRTAQAEGPASGSWNFTALLDGKPIGHHRFALTTEGDQRVLKSEAAFDVTFLGFSAYRYRHDDTERWKGDCLVSMDAKTNDGGKVLSVQAQLQGDALSVQTTQGAATLPGCVMSFAYWNPAMLKQTHLLNAQTGKYETVKIEALGDGTVQARGKTVDAKHYRLTGPEQPIDLWYGADGDWLGLQSTVSGGKRKLVYRLE